MKKEKQNKKILLKVLKVKGDSMSPFIDDSNLIIVSFIPYIFKKPKINDVIVIEHPEKNIKIIKRIKKIHSNKYFVLGDNLKHSTDSRTFGYIDKSLILSKVLFK